MLAIAIVGVLVAGAVTVVLNLGDAPPDVADEPDEPATSEEPGPAPTPTPTPTREPTGEDRPEPTREDRPEPTPRPEPELDEPATTPDSATDEADRGPPRELARQPRTDALPATGGAAGLIAVALLAAGSTLGAARLTLPRRGR